MDAGDDMVEKIGTTGPKEPDKNKKKSRPDSDEYKRAVKKAKESEFEGKRKRKYEKGFEKEDVDKTDFEAPPPPSFPSPDEAYKSKQPKDDETFEEGPIDEAQKAKKTHHKKHKKKEEIVPFKKEEEKITTKEPKEKKEEVKIKEEKGLYKQKDVEKEKSFDESKEKIHPSQMPSVLQEFPKEIALKAHALTSPLTPYLHSDISPLFQKMVGTIIHIESSGLTKTEVILDSKAFQNSIFYGSTITLDRYSTAPNSYNIILKGPNQAVSMFNENLEGLYNSFKKGNFSFQVNRLEAEYERPLFKRKEKTGSKDTDLGSSK
ncbi:MAG: hypothetical protein K1060chlam5_00377 [Candidatus Anoxychlamydiales bacterium]|nr:hypothetical protein [Candidatus Anoxychlamydiales bacterium]